MSAVPKFPVPIESCEESYFKLLKSGKVERYPSGAEAPILLKTGEYIRAMEMGVVTKTQHMDLLDKGDMIATYAEEFFGGQVRARKERNAQLSFAGIV